MGTTTLERPGAVETLGDYDALFPVHCTIDRVDALIDTLVDDIEHPGKQVRCEHLIYVLKDEVRRMRSEIDEADQALSRLARAAKGA